LSRYHPNIPHPGTRIGALRFATVVQVLLVFTVLILLTSRVPLRFLSAVEKKRLPMIGMAASIHLEMAAALGFPAEL